MLFSGSLIGNGCGCGNTGTELTDCITVMYILIWTAAGRSVLYLCWLSMNGLVARLLLLARTYNLKALPTIQQIKSLNGLVNSISEMGTFIIE